MSSKEFVHARHNQAHVEFQSSTSQIGGHAASAAGTWFVFPVRSLGIQPIGQGATEQEAWDNAAKKMSKD
jgi:hypothetical protein